MATVFAVYVNCSLNPVQAADFVWQNDIYIDIYMYLNVRDRAKERLKFDWVEDIDVDNRIGV